MRLLSQLIGARRQLRPLAQADRDELLKWMAERPAPSAFLLGWLERFGMSGTRHNAFFDVYVRGPHGHWSLVALVVHNALVSIVHGDEEDGAKLAALLKRKEQEIQTVVGPDKAVDGFVRTLMPVDFVPRVLQRQTLMQMKRPKTPIPLAGAAYPLRSAGDDDISQVITASLEMHEEEVQSPNTDDDVDALMRSSYQKVREGRVWVLMDPNGALIFKASTSLANDLIAQIEGVWTHPEARGRGIATRCMAQLCNELFEAYNVLSLTVATDNHPAMRVYEKLGFEKVAAWCTAYLDVAPDED